MAELQFAVCRIECIPTPAEAALEVEAILKECAVKSSTLMPDCVNTFFNHLLMVSLDTALYGLTKLIHRWLDCLKLNFPEMESYPGARIF